MPWIAHRGFLHALRRVAVDVATAGCAVWVNIPRDQSTRLRNKGGIGTFYLIYRLFQMVLYTNMYVSLSIISDHVLHQTAVMWNKPDFLVVTRHGPNVSTDQFPPSALSTLALAAACDYVASVAAAVSATEVINTSSLRLRSR